MYCKDGLDTSDIAAWTRVLRIWTNGLDTRQATQHLASALGSVRAGDVAADHQRWPNAYFHRPRACFSLECNAARSLVSVLDGIITNGRAGCGKSARPVLRERGRSYPVPISSVHDSIQLDLMTSKMEDGSSSARARRTDAPKCLDTSAPATYAISAR